MNPVKHDIHDRNDLTLLVNTFYDQVRKDSRIGFFFDKVIPVDWSKHLPLMVDFWDNMLFNTGSYHGNPMEMHHSIHAKHHLEANHFAHWIALFTQTVNHLFEGENAERIKQRAMGMATMIQIKVHEKKD